MLDQMDSLTLRRQPLGGLGFPSMGVRRQRGWSLGGRLVKARSHCGFAEVVLICLPPQISCAHHREGPNCLDVLTQLTYRFNRRTA